MTFCTFRSGQMLSKRHGPVFYQANDEHDPTERTIERGPGEATRRDIGNFASRLALFLVTLSMGPKSNTQLKNLPAHFSRAVSSYQSASSPSPMKSPTTARFLQNISDLSPSISVVVSMRDTR
jgi:hypothetical protein